MLRRLITISLLLIVVGFIANFLQTEQGYTTIEWFNWRMEARTSLLATITLCLICLVIFFDRLLGYMAGLPSRISGNMQMRRDKQGRRALALGLIAAGAGDGREAGRQSKRAQQLIGHDTLTDLLSAQASALNGDTSAATRFFKTLASTQETAFLGEAGLMRLAVEDGRDDAALLSGRAAFALNQNAPNLAKALFTLEAKNEHWDRAITALEVARRDHNMNSKDVNASFAALYYLLAKGDPNAAIENLKRALKADAGFTPAVLAAAGHYEAMGKIRKRIAVLKAGFAATPHPDIADALMDAWGGKNGDSNGGDRTKALAKLIRLTNKHQNHPDAVLACAAAAIGLKLWGEALRLITLIPDTKHHRTGRNAVAWQMLAELAAVAPSDAPPSDITWPDQSAALTRAANAPPPPSWRCSSCNTPHLDWTAQCNSCGGFAQIRFGV